MTQIVDETNANNYADMLKSLSNSKLAELGEISRYISKIGWKQVSFIIPTAPVPSHRPRLSGYRIYVPGAAKNAAFFQKHVLPQLKGLMITTPCKVDLHIYSKTPTSFTKLQTCLAEIGLLRPWGATGDVDNFEKAVYDMIQPNEKRKHTGIMSNDSLIIESHSQKFYSITPRYEISITYMNKIPDIVKKILRLDKQ